ncbi:MAG: ribosome hibernation-promoting factor, HPF/YfiA family [Trueperaceae bacterium]
MNIYKFTGRNLEITDAMKTYTEDKLGKLERFFDHIIDAKVIMSYTHTRNVDPARVEVQINVPNGVVRAEESGQDTYAAVDKAVDKLERQLKRFKDRLREKKAQVVIPSEESNEEEAAQIVRVKKHVLRPMTPDDAAMEMEALSHDFYMFHNSETNLVTVIYLRQDGNYGLLEPAK